MSQMLKILITIDECEFKGELMVIDDEIMNYDAIIGTDILGKGRVVIENGRCEVAALDSNKVTADEKHKLIVLLNSFAGCFGENLNELGKCASVKTNIKLTSDKPIEKKPYSTPFPKQQTVNRNNSRTGLVKYYSPGIFLLRVPS